MQVVLYHVTATGRTTSMHRRKTLLRLWPVALLGALLCLWPLVAAAQSVSPLAGEAQRLDDVAKRVDDAAAAGNWATARQQWSAFENLWLSVEDDFNDASKADYDAIEQEMATVAETLKPEPPQTAAVHDRVAALRGRLTGAVTAGANASKSTGVEVAGANASVASAGAPATSLAAAALAPATPVAPIRSS